MPIIVAPPTANRDLRVSVRGLEESIGATKVIDPGSGRGAAA
jgi:hypothetical protein